MAALLTGRADPRSAAPAPPRSCLSLFECVQRPQTRSASATSGTYQSMRSRPSWVDFIGATQRVLRRRTAPAPNRWDRDSGPVTSRRLRSRRPRPASHSVRSLQAGRTAWTAWLPVTARRCDIALARQRFHNRRAPSLRGCTRSPTSPQRPDVSAYRGESRRASAHPPPTALEFCDEAVMVSRGIHRPRS